MRLAFTKMQGAGNDFVVLDATREPLSLDAAALRRLADRRFGIGADQILVVEPSQTPDVDFRYRIFNGGSGDEVEQCGNGARCFVRYARDQGLTDKSVLVVETMNRRLELEVQVDGRVSVDMGAPSGYAAETLAIGERRAEVATLSMGNPHVVQFVADVDRAPVEVEGRLLQQHPRFAESVNAGFAQIVDRGHIRLRVFERGAGETLACGTGACAAVVAGIEAGLLDETVDVEARGGRLTITWPRTAHGRGAHVRMAGPAETVFTGTIDV